MWVAPRESEANGKKLLLKTIMYENSQSLAIATLD